MGQVTYQLSNRVPDKPIDFDSIMQDAIHYLGLDSLHSTQVKALLYALNIGLLHNKYRTTEYYRVIDRPT